MKKQRLSKGSEILDTREVNIEEGLLYLQVCTNSGDSIEKAAAKLGFIDDCLGMIRMRSIVNTQRFTAKGRIRKDANLNSMISNRLDILMNDIK